MKIKSWFKKGLSILLATSSILTAIPATAYADGIGSNAAGNDSSSVRTGTGGDFGVNLPAGRIGLRFSIVDGDDPSKVISKNVIDYWFMDNYNFKKYTKGGAATTYVQPGGGYYTGVKTQRYDTPNSMITITLDSEKYEDFPLNVLKADPESWAYHNGAYHSRGEKYVEWLDTDASGKSTGGNISEYMKGYLKKDKYKITPYEESVKAGKCKDYKFLAQRTGDSSVEIKFSLGESAGTTRNPVTITSNLSGGSIADIIFSAFYSDGSITPSDIPLTVVSQAAGEVIGLFKDISQEQREEALKAADAKSGTTKASETFNYLNQKHGGVVESTYDEAKEGLTKTAKETTEMSEDDFQSLIKNLSPIVQILNYTPDGEDKPLLYGDSIGMKTYKIKQADGSFREEKRANWEDTDTKWILLVEPLFMLTIFGSTDDENHIILCKQIGTITNLAEALKEKAPNSAAYTSTNWYNWKALNQSLWSALSVRFGNDEMNGNIKGDILPVYKEDGTIDEKRSPANPFTSLSVSPQATRTFDSMAANAHKEGYGVCMWWAGSIGKNKEYDFGDHIPDILEDEGTHTFDSEKYGSGNSSSGKYEKGPAPEPTEEEKKEGVSKGNNVVKFYANKAGTTYTYTDNNVRKDTISPIQIEDEELYIVDGWFTSETFKEPSTKDESFDVYKSSLHNKKMGDRLDKVTLDNNDTLYVRLINNSLTVIKYFTDSSGKNISQPKIEKDLERTSTYDPAEGAWTYKEAVLSNNPPVNATNWSSVPSGSHTTSNPIPVSDGTQTIYIRYIQDNPNNVLILHEDELAHTFRLADINGLVSIVHKFASRWAVSGHYSYCSNCDTDHWRHNSKEIKDEEHYNFDVHNGDGDGSIYSGTNFIGAYGQFRPIEQGDVSDNSGLKESSIYSFSSDGIAPNLQFTIYRDKAKDLITLYPNKSSGHNPDNILSDIGINESDASYIDRGKRVQKEGSTQWYEHFFIDYNYRNLDDTVTGQPSRTCHDASPGWISATGQPTLTLGEFNARFSKDKNVLEKAFVGFTNTGDKLSDYNMVPFKLFGLNFNLNNKYDSTVDTNRKFIQFYPYIKMYYQTSAYYNHDKSEELEAFVTSTNVSKVSKNASVEVGIYRANASGDNKGYGIGLQSEQWSTHSRAISGLTGLGLSRELANHSLIPGGAIVTLTDGNTDPTVPKTYVGFRTYEMSIPDDLKQTLSDTNMVTTSEAKQNGVNFYNQVQSVLKGYQLEKWAAVGLNKNESHIDSNGKKVSGINPVSNFDGNDLQNQSNSKYYLKTANSGANGAQFDLKDQSMEQHVYKIWADLIGEHTYDVKDKGIKVNVSKDGTIMASTYMKGDKNIAPFTSIAELNAVNQKTKFIENFVEALDMDLGCDRKGRTWYYECQDGIEVVETFAKMQLTLGDGNGHDQKRSDVIDTHLCGKLTDHGNILDMSNATTRTVQYRMSAHSLTGDASGKADGYIGTFDGMDIIIPNITNVMRSRLHYMSNNTVMDLN